MRAYFFGNLYLSPIQHGIQAAHVTSELFVKYRDRFPQNDHLLNWAENHKTIVCMNGGMSVTLRGLCTLFENSQNPYPWVSFREADEALDGALTCVGIVLPERIYETSKIIRNYRPDTSWNTSVMRKMTPVELIENLGQLEVEVPSSGETAIWEFNKHEFKIIQKLNEFQLA